MTQETRDREWKAGRDVGSHVPGETRPRPGQGGGRKASRAGAEGVIVTSEKGGARQRRAEGDSRTCALSKRERRGGRGCRRLAARGPECVRSGTHGRVQRSPDAVAEQVAEETVFGRSLELWERSGWHSACGG